MKTIVLKDLKSGFYFKGFGTFRPEFTKNKKEAKRYPKENLEMLEDENAIDALLIPVYYKNGEYVHQNFMKK